jgi:CRISPR/Cas system-associated exonuclease Cas4 (RecB family)
MSYSSLSTFEKCPYQYYFEKVCKVKLTHPNEYAFFVGHVVQGIFEQVINDRIYRDKDADTILSEVSTELSGFIASIYQDKLMEGLKYLPLDLEIKFDKSVKTEMEIYKDLKIVLRPLTSLLKREFIRDLDNVVCEYKYEKTMRSDSGIEYSMIGYADFRVKGKSGISIIDGKRKFHKQYHDGKQLYMYQMLDGEPIRALRYWDYTTNKFHEVALEHDNDSIKRGLELVIEDVYNSYETGVWKKNRDFTCQYCLYKDLCKKSNEEHTEI